MRHMIIRSGIELLKQSCDSVILGGLRAIMIRLEQSCSSNDCGDCENFFFFKQKTAYEM